MTNIQLLILEFGIHINLRRKISSHLTNQEKKCECIAALKFKVYFSWSKCTMIHLSWQSIGKEEEAAHSRKGFKVLWQGSITLGWKTVCLTTVCIIYSHVFFLYVPFIPLCHCSHLTGLVGILDFICCFCIPFYSFIVCVLIIVICNILPFQRVFFFFVCVFLICILACKGFGSLLLWNYKSIGSHADGESSVVCVGSLWVSAFL